MGVHREWSRGRGSRGEGFLCGGLGGGGAAVGGVWSGVVGGKGGVVL